MININSFELTDVDSFILVQNDELYLFEKYGDNYKCLLKTKVLTGKNGFSDKKTEGDLKTPVGTFDILYAFGIKKKPETKLNYIRVNKYCCFVDDPNSRYYNTLVDIRNVEKDWNSAEHLCKYRREYAYAVDIGYNKEKIKGKGSAIFLHCLGNKKYTAGCIAIKRKDLLFCLKHLSNSSKIIIKNPAI